MFIKSTFFVNLKKHERHTVMETPLMIPNTCFCNKIFKIECVANKGRVLVLPKKPLSSLPSLTVFNMNVDFL